MGIGASTFARLKGRDVESHAARDRRPPPAPRARSSRRRRCGHGARDRTSRRPAAARPPGFGALLDIIIAQQVSTASARAIRERLVAAAAPLSPETILAMDDSALRGAGLSRPKVLHVRGIAAALASGALDLDALARRPDEEAIAELVKLKGIGRWSAEVYLLFCLQRPDVLPAEDLALLVAAQRLKRLEQRPTPAELRRMAEPWRPWRSIASRLLWHWYREAPVEG